jgi:hypothetical protein
VKHLSMTFRPWVALVAALAMTGLGLAWSFPAFAAEKTDKAKAKTMKTMPGESFHGPLPPLTDEQKALAGELRRDVEELAGKIGERNLGRYEKYLAAADYIERRFAQAGYKPRRQAFEALGKTCYNLDVELAGTKRPEEILVVGAHYDSIVGTPGANDNASGVAAVLAMAKAFAGKPQARTVRFVAFANEETPFFYTPMMGSLVYAKRCRKDREKVIAMFSLETIGYYSDAPKSQWYPFPFSLWYPSTGNFIALVGNSESEELVREAVGSFRRHARFPSEGAAMSSMIPGVAWSDQWAFWQEGYPGLMVTDTAPYRYPHYHAAADTPEKIDYDRTARVVHGLEMVLEDLCVQGVGSQ